MITNTRFGHSRGQVVLLATLLALSLLAAACGSSASSGQTSSTASSGNALADEGTPVDGGSIVFGIASETSGWNPHYNEWSQYGSMVASSVLEPLAQVGPDNSAAPWLAESWFPNEDFSSWAIHLKPGIAFQNGEPLDAAAVKLNIDDAASGPLSGQALSGLFKQVTVQDNLTVLVEFSQPWAAFPSSFLNGQSAMMMAPSMLRADDHGQARPVGTGPFVLDEWQPGDSFKTSKNPTYWQAGLPHLDRLDFKVITDSTSRTAALESGDINMMLTTSAADANSLTTDYTVIKDWDTEPANVVLNTATTTASGDPNPLSNKDARLALAFATDQEAIAASIGEGVLTPTSPFSPENPWGMPSEQNNYPGFDLDKARAAVEAYKTTTGATSLSFTITGVADVDTQRTMQLLQSQWKDAGIEASIETLESTAFIANLVTGDFNAAMSANYSSPDPDQDHYFWSAATIKGPGNLNINFSQYTTPEIENDLKVGRQSGFPNLRKDAYDDLVKQRNAAAVDIWLNWTPFSIVAEKQVRGLQTAGQIPFANFQPKIWLGSLWRSP